MNGSFLLLKNEGINLTETPPCVKETATTATYAKGYG
jgi:hypothetical protein